MLTSLRSARVAIGRSAGVPKPVRLQVGSSAFVARLDSACVASRSSFQHNGSLDLINVRSYHASDALLASQKPAGKRNLSDKTKPHSNAPRSASKPIKDRSKSPSMATVQERMERKLKREAKKARLADLADPVLGTGEAAKRRLGGASFIAPDTLDSRTLGDVTNEELGTHAVRKGEEDDEEWIGLDEAEAELFEEVEPLEGDLDDSRAFGEAPEYYEEAIPIEEELTPEDLEEELQKERRDAKIEWLHERSRVYKQKRKSETLQKRRKREEFIEQQYKDIYGIDLEEKDGLVGIAERDAKSNPDVPVSSLAEQKSRILQEVMSRHGKAKHITKGQQPQNLHPQAPGGRHERVDPPVYGQDLLWPDRPVNIHMEFPHSARLLHPNERISQDNDPFADIKSHEKHTIPSKDAVDRGLVSREKAEEDARFVAKESIEDALKMEEDAASRAKEMLRSNKPLSLGQIKKLKEAAKMPDWSKAAVALEDLTVHKAVHHKKTSAKAPAGSTNVEYVNASGYSFKDLGIGEALIKGMESNWKIQAPSEIQQLTIPQFMKASNLLIADQTGTGKTLSYLLPALERVLHFDRKNPFYKRRGQRARVLILLPNRELVQQTHRILTTLTASDERFDKWTTYAMAGGTGETVKRERIVLNDGLDVLVSTPERVIFHVEREHLYLDDTMIVIIDEADTLLSNRESNQTTNEFMSSMRDVISQQKLTHLKHVQFVCATATVSPPLMEFLKKEFGDSMISVVGSEIHKSARSLRQDFLFGASGDFKQRLLYDTLKKYPGKRTIVFCNSQSSVKGVVTLLTKAGYSAVGMTSDMPPKIRQRNFKQFSNKDVSILVSTDLASRGLDMGATVEHVILYDFPTNTIDYLHRIGRTARAGAAGHVTAFLGKGDQALAAMIKDNLQEGKSLATIRPSKPDIKAIHALERKRGKGRDRLPKHIHNYQKFLDDDHERL